MPTTIDTILEFLASDKWTEAEKSVIKWQFNTQGFLGDFETALWKAIVLADDQNLARLAAGFPTQVNGYMMWAWGGLAKRLREAGLSI